MKLLMDYTIILRPDDNGTFDVMRGEKLMKKLVQS